MLEYKDRPINVGDVVLFKDTKGIVYNALVTYVFTDFSVCQGLWSKHVEQYGKVPLLNVIYVTKDPNRNDNYGSQNQHASSVCFGGDQIPTNVGYCWMYKD